jgi:hypothetical protein
MRVAESPRRDFCLPRGWLTVADAVAAHYRAGHTGTLMECGQPDCLSVFAMWSVGRPG